MEDELILRKQAVEQYLNGVLVSDIVQKQANTQQNSTKRGGVDYQCQKGSIRPSLLSNRCIKHYV